MNGIETGPHLSDGEAMRYIDGDATPEDSRRWRDHVEGCPRCARAARSLDQDSHLVSEWLARASFESDGFEDRAAAQRDRVGPRAAGRYARVDLAPWLRAAAILALVAAPVAAIPSLRVWVVERVVGDAEMADPETTQSVAADVPTVIRFVPAPGELVVRFAAGSEGAITIDRATNAEAVLTVVGGEPEALVSSATLEISNREPARYHLGLPGTTTGLRIRVGERTVSVSEASIDRGTIIELQRR